MAVNTDPKDLRRLANEITRAQGEIASAIKRVRASLNGAHWNDPVRKKFEHQLAEMESALNRFGHTAQESQRYLNRKAGELETFLRS